MGFGFHSVQKTVADIWSCHQKAIWYLFVDNMSMFSRAVPIQFGIEFGPNKDAFSLLIRGIVIMNVWI